MNFHQPLTGWAWGGNRMDLAVKLATGKRVLHVGCADDGMTGRETLHEKLKKVAKSVIGVDVVPPCDIICDFQDKVWPPIMTFSDSPLPDEFKIELVVCTEVLEHVGNVMSFLMNLRSVGAKEYLFTVPNAFSGGHCDHIWHVRPSFSVAREPVSGEELVHPDHNYYFSPFTLENVLRKAGYTTFDRYMVGFGQPLQFFAAEGVGILCQ